MKLQLRGTIVVLVVFVLLAGVVYLSEMRGGAEAPAQEGRVPIFSFEVEDVVLLAVTDRAANQKVSITRSDGGPWTVVEPISAEADVERIGALLDRLSKLQSSRVLEEQEMDLEAFGLSDPALELEVGLKSGESQVLLVGGQNPAAYSHYTQRDGTAVVYLIASSTIRDLERLVSEPPEKPTPTATGTVPPAINAEPTVSVTGTVTPILTAVPTATTGP